MAHEAIDVHELKIRDMRVLQRTQLDLVLVREPWRQFTALDLVLDELGEAVDELGRAVGVHLLEWKEAVRRDAVAMDVVDALLPISE